jgi:hypothetical protein
MGKAYSTNCGMWMDNIKMDLSDICWFGMNWIDLIQDRDQWRVLMNTVMNLHNERM